LIKANFPSRISFAVTSQVDSRVVLDTPGAEKLLGRGDMLYMASDSSKLSRLQGCFVSDRELDKLVTHWKAFVEPGPPVGGGTTLLSNAPQARVAPSSIVSQGSDWVQGGLWSDLRAEPKKSEEDDLLEQAVQIVQETDRASVSLLQRKLRIGYSRAARLMDLLEQRGYVGEDEGPTRGRQVLKGTTPSSATASKPGSSAGGPATILPPAGRAPQTNTTKASAEPKKSETMPTREDRKFEGDDLGDFDDWTDKDWDDLDRS
jgi:S-DNA-T family DNA segregation ATPase FtsK/SpoIIIE